MKKLISIISALTLLFSYSLPAYAVSPIYHSPIIRNKNGTSLNWSGYANYNSGPVTDVKGSWTVPSLTCGSQNTYSSAWVGIDGYNDNSVEQTGTEQDCTNGVASYYAWFEMYPKPSYKVNLNVQIGDTVNAEVKYLGGGRFQLSLNSARGSFSTTQRSNKAGLASAEWIMEAPYSGGILPLANFGTANFTNSLATINGATKTISANLFDQINMANSSGSLKDQTSPLSPNGSSFSVTWLSSN